MISYQQSTSLTDAVRAYGMLRGLENFYPDFSYWYCNSVMPGVMVGTDVLILAKEHERVIGVALGKRTAEETKLRCVRVEPECQKRGAGIHLVERMLRALDCDKPLCTVSEEMLHQFSRPFINHFNFELTEVDKGRYRAGKLEYVFNAPAKEQ